MIRTVHSLAFVLAISVAGSGCTSSAGTPTAEVASASTTTAAHVEGRVSRVLVSPRGDVDGLLLQDGTTVRFPPHALLATGSALAVGDDVVVDGERLETGAGRVIDRASVQRAGVPIAEADRPPPPPPSPGSGPLDRGGPVPPGAAGPGVPADTDLSEITATGSITSWLLGPRGDIDGFTLSDGTSVRGGPRARIETLGLSIGATVTVRGRGGKYPQGTTLALESVTLPNGQVRSVELPRANFQPVSRDGTVARRLLTPQGDVDGYILSDGTVVRMPPRPRSSASPAGAKIHVSGVGTSSFVQIEPEGAAPPPPAPDGPRPLASITVDARVSRFIDNPEGDHDAVLLEDGSIVRLPPMIRDAVGDTLKIGSRITATGEGGTYDGVKSLHATRLTLGSGASFQDVPPPAPPAVAP